MAKHETSNRQFVIEARQNTLRVAFCGITIGYAMALAAEGGSGVTAIWRSDEGYSAGVIVPAPPSGETAAFLVSCSEEGALYCDGLPEIRRKLREAA